MPADYERNVEEFLIKLMESAGSDDEIVDEIEKYMSHYAQKVDRHLRHLKSELEYERTRYQQARNVFLSHVTGRSELETFFFECLGEMRKEILHKGPRGLVTEEAGTRPGPGGVPTLDASRYEALQAVLSNDRILITLFDEIFGPPTKREEFTQLGPRTAARQVRETGKKATNVTSPGLS